MRFLAALSHVVVLALVALFTGLVLLLGQSALWTAPASPWTKPLLVAMAALALFWPRYGLLLVAALVPLGQIGTRMLGSQMRGSEALVLAFLAGALLRGWWTGRFRRFPSGRIEMAALLFGLVVAASCVEQLWFLQVQRNFPWLFLQDLWTYASREYLVAFRGLGMIFNAMLFLEGLALFLMAVHYCRVQATFPLRLVGMLVTGAVGAAAVNVSNTAALLNQGLSIVFDRRRLTVHIGDPNAAGSYFAMAFFAALGGGVVGKKAKLVWFIAALIIGVALWITQSRTAFVAVMAIGGAVLTILAITRARGWVRVVALTLLFVVPLGVLISRQSSSEMFGRRVGNAVHIRWMFLGTTLRMLEWQPAFGVGVGQYSLWSTHFSTPEFLKVYRAENAHNNFSQVAGELGLVGLVGFVGLLGSAIVRSRRAFETSPVAQVGLVGAAACMFTWLGGHPLLAAAVAYPFWILLGVPASADAPPATSTTPAGNRFSPRSTIVAALAVVLLGASLPLRLETKSGTLDWTRIAYGFYGWEKGPSGEAFRWMGPRARFFVPATATGLTIPFRANAVTRENPIRLELFVNGRLADQIEMSDAAWQTLRVAFPPASTGRYHVDLRVNRTWVPADVIPGSEDSRRLGVQVGVAVVQSAQEAETGGA